jgi:hypothetical protein
MVAALSLSKGMTPPRWTLRITEDVNVTAFIHVAERFWMRSPSTGSGSLTRITFV